MDLEPNITICVTTYNRKNLLPITINSILTQSYDNFEIIIVDDYSTDGTEELVKHTILTMDSRIRYIRHKKNKGLATARNTAIFNAKGRYFTFVDDDDTWAEDFLKIFINEYEKLDDTYSLCASGISNHTNVQAITGKIQDFLFAGYTPPVASQFYRTKILQNIGGYDENIKSGVDHDLWLTLGKNNLNLLWLNIDIVSINTIESANRMTYNIDKRVNGIKASMVIWIKKLEVSYGKYFLICLEKNYQYNTYKKFLLYAFKRKNFLQVFQYFFKLPIKLFLLDLKRYFLSKFDKKLILKHPTFEPCKDISISIKVIKK